MPHSWTPANQCVLAGWRFAFTGVSKINAIIFSGRPVVALWRKQEQGGAAIRIVPTGEWQLWNDKNSIQKHKIKVNKNRKLLYIPCVWIVQEQACKNKQRFSSFWVFFTVFAEQAKLKGMYLRLFIAKTQFYNYRHITFKTNMELLPTIYFRCLKLYYLYTFANEHKNELFLQPKQSMNQWNV